MLTSISEITKLALKINLLFIYLFILEPGITLCISGEAILYKFWYFPSQLTFPFGGNQNSFEWYKFWNFLSHVKILNFSKLTKQFFWTYDFGYMISCTRLRYTTFRFWFKTNWTSMFSSTTMLTNRNKLWIINCDNLVLVLT